MAPAPSRCRMGACETTPPTTPREPTPQSQPLPLQPAGSSWPPMIGRRYPASSSFVLAGALPGARLRALQLDPGHAPARTGSSKENHTNRHHPARRTPRSHRANSPRPLDNRIPHGCGNVHAEDLAGRVVGAARARGRSGSRVVVRVSVETVLLALTRAPVPAG